jgi:hypothetical protein
VIVTRLLSGTAGLSALALLVRAAQGVPHAMGARRARLRAAAAASPHAADGLFRNTEPGVVIRPGSAPALLRAALTRGRTGTPTGPVPLATEPPPGGPPSALAVTWFGHSSVLLEIDGHRVLADPV